MALIGGMRRREDICEEIAFYVGVRYCSPAARVGNLAKIPPIQVIGDFGRGSSVESESE